MTVILPLSRDRLNSVLQSRDLSLTLKLSNHAQKLQKSRFKNVFLQYLI